MLAAWVSSAQETESDFADALDCSGAAASSPLCVEKAFALSLKAKFDALYPRLSALSKPPWDASTFANIKAMYDEGMPDYRKGYFGAAAERFKPALTLLEELAVRYDNFVTDLEQRAASALESNDAATAKTLYEELQAVNPESEVAGDALKSIANSFVYQAKLNDAEALFNQGELKNAEQRLSEIPASWNSRQLANLRIRIARQKEESAFTNLINKAYDFLDAQRYREAELAFLEAQKLKPNSVIVTEALETIALNKQDVTVAQLEQQIEIYENDENWVRTLEALSRLRDLQPNNVEIGERIATVTKTIDIEATLDRYIEDIGLIDDRDHRDEIGHLLTIARDPALGARVMQKRDRLEELYDVHMSPVQVTLYSDNKTTISVRPGVELGSFNERVLSMLPGNYVILGRRPGYREKSITLALLPDTEPVTLRVECDEQF